MAANFWNPFFEGQKMTKLEVKNLKRLLRRTLYEMLFENKPDRSTIQNMSDSVFIEKLMNLEDDFLKRIKQKLLDLNKIVIELGVRCENFRNTTQSKKIYIVYELLNIQQILLTEFSEFSEDLKTKKKSKRLKGSEKMNLLDIEC